MVPFRERLTRPGALVGDGAWGTMLAARGLPAGAPPERWTLEHPGIIEEIARAYADAGAELITTNTFGASPMRLAHYRLADQLDTINRRGVELARRAAEGRAYVSASIGPTGRLLAPLGDADQEEVSRGFATQAHLLLEAGADAVSIETMTALEEAVLAVRAVRALSAGVPIIAMMTFEITPRGPFTMMGVSVDRAAAELAAAGADLVGANCGAGVDEMIVVADALLVCAQVPVAIQPNAGLPVRLDGMLTHPETPEAFAQKLGALAARGVKIVGGCCGTTPAHIAALRAVMPGE